MSELKREVKKNIIKRKELHLEDCFSIEKSWEELMSLLSKNAEETIKILLELDEEEVLYVSEVFEEIAENLQSCDYIECLRTLDKKFPNSHLKRCVDVVENFMDKKC